MKKLLLFSLAALPLAGHAQLSSYKLSDYVNPDYHYQSLDFQFNASNAYNPYTTIQDGDKNTETKSKANGSVAGTYYSYRNSRNYQGDLTGSLSYSGAYSYDKDGSAKTKNYGYAPSLSITSNNRFYGSNLYFFELSPSASINYSYSKTKTTTESTSKSLGTNLGLSALVGKGRIEQVQDARLALYILDDLKSAGLLSHEPSNEEYLALAAEITKIINTRFFDARIHKMAELKALDTYLQSKGLISKEGIDYFNILNDNWDYSAGPARNSGYRVSTGFSANNQYYWTNDNIGSGDGIEKRRYSTVSYLINFSHEKPVSRFLQQSFNANAALGYSGFRDAYSDIVAKQKSTPTISAAVGYSLGYYPNSRTYIKGTVSQNYTHDFTKEYGTGRTYTTTSGLISTEGLNNEFLGLTSNLRINAYYYFSPQLRLTATFQLSYVYYRDHVNLIDAGTENNTQRDFTENFNIGFTYSLF
jgi:hypothetical protein